VGFCQSRGRTCASRLSSVITSRFYARRFAVPARCSHLRDALVETAGESREICFHGWHGVGCSMLPHPSVKRWPAFERTTHRKAPLV
jgi:hypothetical protein